MKDGAVPSAKLREIEVEGNNVFDVYRDLYFDGGVSSMYAWDLDAGFAAVVLIKKTADASRRGAPMKGVWDSIHVVEVQEQGKSGGVYNLTSTVMLSIRTKAKETGSMEVAGSLTRQANVCFSSSLFFLSLFLLSLCSNSALFVASLQGEFPVDTHNTHIKNIGRMIEDLENKLRSHINLIYFGKTKDIVNTLRSVASLAIEKERRAFADKMHSDMGK